MPATLTSPHDQKVTFVELFFDLVFVFSITQIVGILHHGLTLEAIGQALLAFWLVWWAWTQYTWALNAADTTHYYIQLGTLVATGLAFFMAVSVPFAFGEGTLWFAITYVLVRILGLVIYARVASENEEQKKALKIFAIASVGGLVAVIAGGIAGGTTLYWLWGLSIILDIAAAALGGKSDGWDIHPEHFAERHGLFVIIALGETLIVAASGVTTGQFTRSLELVAIFAVATTCSMWWSYFPRTKPMLDEALEKSIGSDRSGMARDVFSLIHFPMMCGVIACAAVLEHAISHPDDPLSSSARAALAIGIVLFVGGMALAITRATKIVLIPRLILIAATGALVYFMNGVPPYASLSIAVLGILSILLLEARDKRLPDVSA